MQDLRAQNPTPGLSHRALIYRDAAEFLDVAVPFLREGLAAGEPVLVAVGPARTAELRAELGPAAAAARFLPGREVSRNPARLIPLWRDFLAGRDGRPARGIGEPAWAGRDGAALDECHRHEALVNVAFAAAPALSLLCTYDAALDGEALARVSGSHQCVHRGGWEASADFAAASDCFAGALPPPPLGTEAFAFAAADLHEARARVAGTALRAGLNVGGAADLVAAASELAANSVTHGGGGGLLRTWRDRAGAVVEIADRGRLREPLAGRQRPGLSQEHCRGLWLANQLCDLVRIRSGPAGTVVRLHLAAAGP